MDGSPRQHPNLLSLSQYISAMKHFRSITIQELDITGRMLADNAFASSTPVLVFVFAVCIRTNVGSEQTAVCLFKAVVLAMMYTYVFDISNQATSSNEDKVNKPYRPIPQGLLTRRGALNRFWFVAVLYILVAWTLGVMRWALLWVISSVIINLACPPQHHFWCKTICMSMGVSSQLAQAWELVTPLDAVGKRWIMFLAVTYPPPLIFEDVRDMPGDKAVGRQTFALMLGDGPIRVWFASIMVFLPALVHVVLFSPTDASANKTFWCSLSVAVVCWTMAWRAMFLRNVKSDRQTYQGFISSYVLVLICGGILWR